ncbi:hypothetical protein [Allomesorhizobium alhagi]|nr:hypothetical protein [Mesorhizobium alhagi]
MKPVFGTPTGTGILPIGGIATQTPTAKISGNADAQAAERARWLYRNGGLNRGAFPPTRGSVAPAVAT